MLRTSACHRRGNASSLSAFSVHPNCPPSLAGSGITNALSLVRHNGVAPARYVPAAAARPARSILQRLRDPSDLIAVTSQQAISDLRAIRPDHRRSDTVESSALPAPQSAYQALMREGLGASLSNAGVPRINEDTVMRLGGIPAGGNTATSRMSFASATSPARSAAGQGDITRQ